MTGRPEVTAIESIRHEGVKHWTELGIHLRYSGTTKTTFLSTIKHGSPIAPAIIAIISAVITLIIYAIIAFVVWTVASVIREIVTAAPAGLGSLALLAVIGFGIYAYMKTKERK